MWFTNKFKGRARYKGWQSKPRDQVKNCHIKYRFYPERKEGLLRDFSGKIYIVKGSNTVVLNTEYIFESPRSFKSISVSKPPTPDYNLIGLEWGPHSSNFLKKTTPVIYYMARVENYCSDWKQGNQQGYGETMAEQGPWWWRWRHVNKVDKYSGDKMNRMYWLVTCGKWGK